jgi:hypothetical protein
VVAQVRETGSPRPMSRISQRWLRPSFWASCRGRGAMGCPRLERSCWSRSRLLPRRQAPRPSCWAVLAGPATSSIRPQRRCSTPRTSHRCRVADSSRSRRRTAWPTRRSRPPRPRPPRFHRLHRRPRRRPLRTPLRCPRGRRCPSIRRSRSQRRPRPPRQHPPRCHRHRSRRHLSRSPLRLNPRLHQTTALYRHRADPSHSSEGSSLHDPGGQHRVEHLLVRVGGWLHLGQRSQVPHRGVQDRAGDQRRVRAGDHLEVEVA